MVIVVSSLYLSIVIDDIKIDQECWEREGHTGFKFLHILRFYCYGKILGGEIFFIVMEKLVISWYGAIQANQYF